MTDTIGWGDVDVEPRRRRLPRVRPVFAWPAAAVVLAAVVLTPRVESRFADDAAAWLQREWKVAAAYDTARQAIVLHATERATTGDADLFLSVIRDVDRDEARQLARIATQIERHRSWSSDVGRAKTAARTALRAEAHDLLAQAPRPQVVFSGSFFVSPAASTETQQLLSKADDLVTATAHRHHVHLSHVPSVRLTGAANPLAQLDRLTASPLPILLAIAHDGDLDVWNLEDGSVRRAVTAQPDDGSVIRRVGNSVLTQTGGRWSLVPVRGGTPVQLPRAADYLPAGDEGLWEVDGSVVRRLDAAGHQIGRTFTIPAAYGPPFAATADALVIALNSPYAGTLAFLWTPTTGRLLRLPRNCDASATAGEHQLVYETCDRNPHLVVMDTRSGRTHELQPPRGMHTLYGSAVISEDGRRVAALVAEAADDDPASGSTAVWSLDSNTVRVVFGSGSALAWAPDGSVLIADTDLDSGNTSNLPLAYWTPGAPTLLPIRIPLTETSPTIAVLPAG